MPRKPNTTKGASQVNNQEILDNAPEGEGDDFVDITGEYFDEYGNHLNSKGLWSDSDTSPVSPLRSLADIKRIVELEKELSKVKAYKAQLLAHVKYTSTQEEVEIIKLEQQAKGVEGYIAMRKLAGGSYCSTTLMYIDELYEQVKALQEQVK